jgi:hypothetical protein
MPEMLPPKISLLMINESTVGVKLMVIIVCSSVTDAGVKVSLAVMSQSFLGNLKQNATHNAHRISYGTSDVVMPSDIIATDEVCLTL